MSVLLTPGVSGAIASVTDYNTNLNLLESSFADLGPYVVSGLAVSIGTGLAVNVAAGTANIGGHVVYAGATIGGLTPSTTNHLYLLQTGVGTANTTGTAPANSVKLGTCVTSAGAVSSVAQNWGSGRQQFVEPQSLVLGSGAGNPRSLNLASWAASGSEGQECIGVLPAGAIPGTLGALTLTGNLTLSTHNLVTDTVTGTQIGTSSSQLLGLWGAAPVAQPAGSTDVLAGLISIGARGAGANPNLNIGSGTLTAGVASLGSGAFIGAVEITAAGLQGNGQMLRLLYATASFASDANLTLGSSLYPAGILVVSSTATLTATRSLIYPLNQGGVALVRNATTGGQAITVIGATGTGVTIANGKTALVYCDGTNFGRGTADA